MFKIDEEKINVIQAFEELDGKFMIGRVQYKSDTIAYVMGDIDNFGTHLYIDGSDDVTQIIIDANKVNSVSKTQGTRGANVYDFLLNSGILIRVSKRGE